MLDKEVRKSFIISLSVTLLITLFIQPLFKFLWPFFLNFGSVCFNWYLNGLFKESAKGQNNISSLYTFLFVLWGLLGIISLGYFEVKSKFKRILQQEKQDSKEEVAKRIERMRRKLKLLPVLLVITYFIYFEFSFNIAFQYLSNRDFQQNIDALLPYLTEQEEEIFRSKWALMRSRVNFNEIKDQLNVAANKNGIRLPGSLVK